jgi:uncharacterized protein
MGRARAQLPAVDDIAIRRVADRVVAACDPIRVVLFGSHARGEGRVDSDIDLFVEMESDRPARERRIAIRRLLDDEGYPLDVVVMTPDEVAEARQQAGSILSFVDAEGLVLYERG